MRTERFASPRAAKIQYIYIWAAVVSLLWIQIMECIAIFSEKYEGIACIQEKHSWVVS